MKYATLGVMVCASACGGEPGDTTGSGGSGGASSSSSTSSPSTVSSSATTSSAGGAGGSGGAGGATTTTSSSSATASSSASASSTSTGGNAADCPKTEPAQSAPCASPGLVCDYLYKACPVADDDPSYYAGTQYTCNDGKWDLSKIVDPTCP